MSGPGGAPAAGSRRAPVVPRPTTPAVRAEDPGAEDHPGYGGSSPLRSRRSRPLVWIALVAGVAALVSWVALTPVPHRHAGLELRWFTVHERGFRIDLPAAPVPTPGPGPAQVTTAVAAGNAFTVVWFPVAEGSDPAGVLSQALQALARAPATVTSTRPGMTGPFASADVSAKLASGFLHARLLVVGRRGYLVGVIGAAEKPPPELDRLLLGFDPDPAAI
ncbi:MAG: hypothetical protein NVS3B21_02260 [Acidimicrobiales bacterium]